MKKITSILFLILTLILLSTNLFCQNITISEMETLLNKPDWNAVNSYLINKNWEFYNSEPETDDNLGNVIWTFEKESYSDKAEAWFYLYFHKSSPAAIKIFFFDSEKYNQLLNSLTGKSYKKQDSKIDNSNTTTTYENYSYYVMVETTKREPDNNSYNTQSTIQYSFTVSKKGSILDPNNGEKIEYWSDGITPKYKYNLVNGKIHGEFKQFYLTGELFQHCTYRNGKKNGLMKEYSMDGALAFEFNLKEDIKHGVFKAYNRHGLYQEVNYYNGKIEGNGKVIYYNSDESIFCIETGVLKDDLRIGKWDSHYPNILDSVFNCYVNYKNGELHGAVYDFLTKDTLTTANYINGQLHGDYHTKVIATMVLGNPGSRFPMSGLVDDSKGKYNYGLKNGYWHEYESGDLCAEGYYSNNKKNGLWKYYIASGNTLLEAMGLKGWQRLSEYNDELMWEVEYKNGKENGKETRYFYRIFDKELNSFVVTPTYRTGNYIAGKLHGAYFENYNNGEYIEKGQYANGLQEGTWILEVTNDEGEIITTTANFTKDKLDGSFSFKNENGITFFKMEYKNGISIGDKCNYNTTTGILESVQKHNNSGEQIQLDYYYASGNIATSNLLQDGFTTVYTKYLDIVPKNILYKLTVISNNNSNYTALLEHYYNGIIINKTYKFKAEGLITEHNCIDDGYLEGPFKYISKDVLIVGNYKGNQKQGDWVYYYPIQNITKNVEYEKNTHIEEKYLEGQTENLYTGMFICPGENNTQLEIKIKKGLRHGKTKVFNTDGILISTTVYKVGKKVN